MLEDMGGGQGSRAVSPVGQGSLSLNVCPFVGERGGGGGAPVLCPQWDRDLSVCVCFMSVSDGWLRCLNTLAQMFISFKMLPEDYNS